MLSFTLIGDSSVFLLDVTRECKATIEMERPFEEMCDNFLVLSSENEQKL